MESPNGVLSPHFESPRSESSDETGLGINVADKGPFWGAPEEVWYNATLAALGVDFGVGASANMPRGLPDHIRALISAPKVGHVLPSLQQADASLLTLNAIRHAITLYSDDLQYETARAPFLRNSTAL